MKIPVCIIEQVDHIGAGETIRRRRMKKKISLRTLAKKMGVSAPYISDLERGRRSWSEARFNQAVKLTEP